MFQKKIDVLFSGIPKVFNIADNDLIASFVEQGNVQSLTRMKH